MGGGEFHQAQWARVHHETYAQSPQKRALGCKPDLRLACSQRRVAVHQVAIVWNALGQEITQAFDVVAPVAL